MRLIDKDALLKRLQNDPLFDLVERYGVSGVINAEPTVDAVPVEWLKEHYPTKQVYGTEQYFRTAYAVQDILAEWEREEG